MGDVAKRLGSDCRRTSGRWLLKWCAGSLPNAEVAITAQSGVRAFGFTGEEAVSTRVSDETLFAIGSLRLTTEIEAALLGTLTLELGLAVIPSVTGIPRATQL